MEKVEVRIHQPNPSRDQDSDAFLGATHALHGKPVQVTVYDTPHSSFSHHLSKEQAEALYLQLGEALGETALRVENARLREALERIHALVTLKDWAHGQRSMMQERILANIPRAALAEKGAR